MNTIVCTCIYNRTNTLPEYVKSFQETTTANCELIFIVNYDNLWSRNVALENFYKGIDKLNRDYILIITPNIGLRGFNYGLDIGRRQNCPVFLCNDDVIFGKNWCENLLKTDINEATLDVGGEKKSLDPNSIGVIAPTYKDAGCQRHQQHNPSERGYSLHWFISGHAQLITKTALEKGFSFKDQYCSDYGPFDVYQSQTMQLLGLNQLVSRETCFDLHSNCTYHCGKPEIFEDRSRNEWHKMLKKIEGYKKDHIKKYGFDKWCFTN